MLSRSAYLVAGALLGMSFGSGVAAQTADASKKNCTHPRATYSPSPPGYHVKKNLGVATFELLVDEKGKVSAIKLTQSSGSDGFDRDAAQTVRTWKFEPSNCDGKPTPARIAVEVMAVVR